MKLKEGPITEDELMQHLANAKKVMNKVSTGRYEKGNITENTDDTEVYAEADRLLKNETQVSKNLPSINEERIDNSNLPDAIKDAMKKHPIQQIKLDDSLNMDFIQRTKKIMEQEGVSSRKSKQPQNAPVIDENNLTAILTPIIENIIRKTLDEIVDKKLTQILTAHQTANINENLVLKVGESIFQGKITKVSKAK